MTSAFARIGRLLSVETQKVLGGWSLRVGLSAVLGVTVLALLAHERVAEETPWTLAAEGFAAGLWAAEIFLLVAGATAIAGETAIGTLKMVLPHAYRRGDWLAAKALLLLAQAVVLLAVALGTALVGAALSGGLGDVTQTIDATFGGAGRTDVLRPAGEMWGLVGASAVVGLGALAATAVLGLMLSSVFDGVVPALSAGFLVFLGMKSAGAVFGASPAVLERIYAWYPSEMLGRVAKLGRGFAESWNETMLTRGLSLSGLVIAGGLVVSLLVFGRRDLHA